MELLLGHGDRVEPRVNSGGEDLFDAQKDISQEPLAARMRPRTLDEYIGQDHIVGKNRLLRRAIQADRLSSVIFYGPPGTGKTTLARVIANHTKSNFVTLNAVLAGVSQIRASIDAAAEQRKLYGRRTILFVDEVHRWNKSQQDALLPWVENGTIILIGATTENPFFEVNKALVSRSRVFQLKPLEEADLKKAALAAMADKERGYGKWHIEFEKGALEHLIETAAGDARSLLNALELAVETSVPSWPPEEGLSIFITAEAAEESIQKKVVLYDRDGDYHYDVISAFIKSLRGRDPDAAMYWLARMIAAGESPDFIFRRMLISACEDTGLADPHAVSVVASCAAAFDRVGMPEGQYHLAHAALYLATAEKSNSSLCFFDALAAVEKENAEVPNHLKDPSRDAEGFGHGAGYFYPHSYKDHWIAQQYLPDTLSGKVFYTPGKCGYEKEIREDVLRRRELQVAAILEEAENEFSDGSPFAEAGAPPKPGQIKGFKKEENLTFSPGGKQREQWQKRLDSTKSEALLEIRNRIIKRAKILRHHRILIFGADDGLLLWEASRQTPEGFTAGFCRTEKSRTVLLQYAMSLDDMDKPVLEIQPEYCSEKPGKNAVPPESYFSGLFDRVLARNPAADEAGLTAFASKAASFCVPGGKAVFSAQIPSEGMKLFKLVKNPGLREKVAEAEKRFLSETENPVFKWNGETLKKKLVEQGKNEGWENILVETGIISEYRKLTRESMDKWFDPDYSAYGKKIRDLLGEQDFSKMKSEIYGAAESPVPWPYTILVAAIDIGTKQNRC